MRKVKENYWFSLTESQQEEIATKCGSRISYMTQIAYGNKRPSAVLAKSIHKATTGRWPKHVLRPDVYDDPNSPPQG